MIPTFITVRSSSGRLPNKCLLPLGQCNVLEHVIRRCKFFGFRTIVCTTTEKTDEVVEHISNNESVEIYRGNPVNVQVRWFDCAESFEIDKFHTVDCDDPYFDPLEVQRSFNMLDNYRSILPTTSSALHGLGMMGTSWSMKNSGTSKRMPERGQEFHVRLTLDYPEDYWLLRTLHHLHCDYSSSRGEVEDRIRNSTIASLNAFRHVDWQATQAMENKNKEAANG